MFLKKHLLLIFFFLFHIITAQRFLNSDFEKVNDENLPLKWYLNGKNYLYETDNIIKISGNKSLKVTSNSPKNTDFASFFCSIPTELFKGKELRLVGKIKVQSTQNGNAGLWVRVNDANNKVLAFDNMSGKRITGNTDWTEASITLKVNPDAEKIIIGGISKGEGVAWFDDFKLFANNKPIEDISKKEKLTLEEADILKKYIYPLKTYDPDSKDNNDLKILKKLIGNSKTVALGEVTHGSSEIFKMKDRIIRYLVPNEGFNLFSIEAAMPESYQMNNYIIDGKGSAKEYLNGMIFWTWKTNEILNMVEWMKQYNQSTDKKVYFSGFDMQSFTASINELKKQFQNNPASLQKIEELNKLLEKIRNQFQNDKKQNIDQKDRDIINSIISEIKKDVENKGNNKDLAFIKQNIRIIEQYLDLNSISRDKYMAENVLWIKNNNPDSKMILWAHNGHIDESRNNMGYFLSEQLGKDYLTFGFAFYSGRYTAKGDKGLSTYDAQEAYLGSYEYFLNSLNEPYFILDIKKIKEDNNEKIKWIIEDLDLRRTGAVNHLNEFYPTDISKNFDYLIFINKSSNSVIFKQLN
ncbi:hypothetical protein BBI01_18530 [Chryseobacterium artocarpi]|uniref:Erythromycin esterase n=1 Tax=Chryseobacterium artocarpi TaxID=1414727 RepID=A0A1B8Z9Z7_9FLAO|nr:erythromycin esterase family protein [Chryseobacterium artocarpi]OCA68441.1 hypothetical protein BBI01_18530 [Chryseobacterium artocarpi]